MGTVIQMYGSGVPANNLASIDVPRDGKMIGIDWAAVVDPSGADFSVTIQVSFGSTAQSAVNDSRSSISNIRIGADLTTSGAAVMHANKYTSLPDIAVGAGERIYVHATGTAIVVTFDVCLHFDFELDRALARRR